MAPLDAKRRALLVGTGRYDNASEFTELKTPVSDVKGLEAILRDPQRGKFTDVEVLTDVAASRLWKSAETLFNSAGRDDFVLFYFSGHGKISQQGKASGRLHGVGRVSSRGTLLRPRDRRARRRCVERR
jgi:hypothetical protein